MSSAGKITLTKSKMKRLASGGAPRVLDLFAGCGGLSLGFHREGFEIAAAIEIDDLAARSHAMNFFRSATPQTLQAHAKARDITRVEPAELLHEYGYSPPFDRVIDVIVGGPPCQA